MNKRGDPFLYVKMDGYYQSHHSHPIQPGSIIYYCRKTGRDSAIFTVEWSPKGILLDYSQVIPLLEWFQDKDNPTEEELSTFKMVFNIEYPARREVGL